MMVQESCYFVPDQFGRCVTWFQVGLGLVLLGSNIVLGLAVIWFQVSLIVDNLVPRQFGCRLLGPNVVLGVMLLGFKLVLDVEVLDSKTVQVLYHIVSLVAQGVT